MQDLQDSRRANPKVVLIGIDSATWHVMMPLVQAGRLPNFAHLMENGAYGPLKTFYPTLSPVIWGTISTGKKPERHGMRSFTVLKIPGLHKAVYDYRWEQLTPRQRLIHRLLRLQWWKEVLLSKGIIKRVPLTSNLRKCKAIWSIASEYDRTVGFVSWWTAWPVEEVNGFMISQYFEDWLTAPSASIAQVVYPPEVLSEATEFLRVDQIVTKSEIERFFNLEREEIEELAKVRYESKEPNPVDYPSTHFLKLVYLRQEFRSQAGLHFYQKYWPDLFGVFLDADAVQHFFWHGMEPRYFDHIGQEEINKFGKTIENWYVYLDEIVGKFLQVIDRESTVVIVSDHGHGPSGKLPWSGQHEDAPDGMIVLSGTGIEPGVALDGATVYDIVPTVAALMGLPVASDLDGRTLLEVFTPKFLNQHPIRYIETYETEERAEQVAMESEVDDAVLERLKALGYIE